MISQSHVDRSSCSTAHDSCEPTPAVEPNRSGSNWEFVNNIERLLGSDAEPDPLFFVESWTLGMHEAVESWRKRRMEQTDRERQHRAVPEIDSLGVQSIVRQGELHTEFATLTRCDAKARRSNVCRAQLSPDESASWPQNRDRPEWQTLGAECDGCQGVFHPMSLPRARKLLGVTASSTRRQIKVAYRRKVNQSHPDRLEHMTEGVLRIANDQMAEINEAYRLLCSGLL